MSSNYTLQQVLDYFAIHSLKEGMKFERLTNAVEYLLVKNSLEGQDYFSLVNLTNGNRWADLKDENHIKDIFGVGVIEDWARI